MSTSGTASGKNRIRIVVALAVLVGAIILLLTSEWASIVPGGAEKPEPAETGSTIDAAGDHPQVATLDEPKPAEGPTAHRAFGPTINPPPASPRDAGVSPLADKLNDPAGTIRDDMEIVGGIFTNYLHAFKEAPIGTNAEITAALAGDNSRGHAPLAADSPAINSNGELVDRWGTPFFFHQMSANSMDVRSAGPDRTLYTSDDTLWADGEIQDTSVSVADSDSN
jgi:hypothetical protein